MVARRFKVEVLSAQGMQVVGKDALDVMKGNALSPSGGEKEGRLPGSK